MLFLVAVPCVFCSVLFSFECHNLFNAIIILAVISASCTHQHTLRFKTCMNPFLHIQHALSTSPNTMYEASIENNNCGCNHTWFIKGFHHIFLHKNTHIHVKTFWHENKHIKLFAIKWAYGKSYNKTTILIFLQ